MSFENLGLIEPLLKAVREEGYTHPTPIQEQAIGLLLDGNDLLGCAQTGTGKTAAFALPILQHLATTEPHPVRDEDDAKPPEPPEPPPRGRGGRRHGRKRGGRRHVGKPGPPVRALIVTPTRELAAQIGESFEAYGRHTGIRSTVVHGGVRKGPQAKAVRAGVDVLVATPGRLLDLMGDKVARLYNVEVLVLDEADRMLDMGFIRDIRRIVAHVPDDRQTMLFSATMPKTIQHLADSILDEPEEIRIAPQAPAAETVDQQVYFVEPRSKQDLLQHLLTETDEISRALVFARTKRGADRIVLHLQHADINADVIHSDKSQKDRQRVLNSFKEGRTRVLVASDIAARGLDVEDISHVINYDVPEDADTYVHRIGRTGRAGQAGRALSFCGLGERDHLAAIERLIDRQIPTVEEHPFRSPVPRRNSSRKRRMPTAWRRLSRGRRPRGGRR